MKKLACILSMLLMLCACGNNAEEPQNDLPDENVSSLPASENSKQPEDEDENKLLGEIEEFEIYTESYTDGMRFDLVFNEEKISVPEEVPNTEYYVVDSEGSKIIEHPFDYCILYGPEQMFSHPEYYTLSGSYNGNSYKYIFKDGKFEEYLFEPAGETGEELFGYRLTRYCWYNEYLNYGINDSEGNVVFEPVYTKIEMPFKDRFVLGEGGQGMFTSQGEGRYLITDTEGNILAMYTYVKYIIFDDGSYIGIASVAGGDSVKCYDENGNTLTPGYYFINKDGKCLSGRFEEFTKDVFAASSPEDVFTAIDENGNESKITIKDYLITE